MAEYGWPRPIGKPGLIGLVGEFIETVAPHTEADPNAILLQFLVAFGNCAGRAVQVEIDPQRPQHLNLFTVIVGPTAVGRKGTSLSVALRPFGSVDPDWLHNRIDPGLATGEGLIKRLQDRAPIYTRPVEADQDDVPPIMRDFALDEATGRKGGTFRERQIARASQDDKRLLALCEEFGRTLRMKTRGSNTLWDVLRTLFDRGSASLRTKHSPITATDCHVSLIGHITKEELELLTAEGKNKNAVVNGEFNRILWGVSLMTRSQPRGRAISDPEQVIHWELLDSLRWCQERVEPIALAPEAEEVWDDLYRRVDLEEQPEMVARGQVLMCRLAGIYAAVARSPVVTTAHLRAAEEVWRYSRESALHIFTETTDSAAVRNIPREELKARQRQGKLREWLREAPGGLTRDELWAKSSRNWKAHELQNALDALIVDGEAHVVESEDGKPRWMGGP